MKKTLLLCLSLACSCLPAQTIWQETFTYPDGTTTGANLNTVNPDPDWTATCATCIAGDWFEVRANQMEGLDTNGPGTLTTEVIDISAYPAGVIFEVDLAQGGIMEGCAGACDFNCIDWVRIEYSLNGGAFTDWTSPFGGSCATAPVSAPNSYVTFGNFAAFTFSQTGIVGNTLQIRISVQNWAAGEQHFVDNIIVFQPVPAPVEILSFQATLTDASTVSLDWEVGTEDNVQAYLVERRLAEESDFQIIGEVQANGLPAYQFEDRLPYPGPAFYRLFVLDFDGQFDYSNTVEVSLAGSKKAEVFPQPALGKLHLRVPGEALVFVQIRDLTGRVVATEAGNGADELSVSLNDLSAGLYLYELRGQASVWKGRFLKE